MVRVRAATAADRVAVLNVLDGAALAVDGNRLDYSLARGATLVAEPDEGGVVLGALVRDGDEIEAIAVRRRRRGQGIGTALVDAAKAECDRIVAAFDPQVQPFWTSLGFDAAPVSEADRLRGVWTADAD